MHADVRVVAHVARLLVLAQHVGELEQGALHRRRVVRVGPEIAVAPGPGREQRRAAAQVEDQVALGEGVVARQVEGEAVARRRPGRRVAVHVDGEGAQVALGLRDGAAEDRHVHDRWRQKVAGLAQQHRDVEPAGELLGGLERALVAAVDQADARGLEGDGRRRLGRDGAGGDQRRDLGAALALAASSDQPAVSRMLRKATGVSEPSSPATSANSGASWVAGDQQRLARL